MPSIGFASERGPERAQSSWLTVRFLETISTLAFNQSKQMEQISYRSCRQSCCRHPPPSNTVPVLWLHRRGFGGGPTEPRGKRSAARCLSCLEVVQEGTLPGRWWWGRSWTEEGMGVQRKDPKQNIVLEETRGKHYNDMFIGHTQIFDIFCLCIPAIKYNS